MRKEVWLERHAFDERARQLRDYSKAFQRQQFEDNPDGVLAARRAYYVKNKARCDAKSQKWQRENSKRVQQWVAAWRKRAVVKDPTIRLIANMRTRMYAALLRQAKSTNTFKLLGCSGRQEYRQILSSRFSDGMSWSNYGKWTVDHVIPCRAFTLRDALQQQICFHHSNLQPMWKLENMAKGARYGLSEVNLVLSRCPDSHRPFLQALRARLENSVGERTCGESVSQEVQGPSKTE